ncbi:MAG TPA: hypothetical protein VN193_09650 [Candidatus Angelobacter sp.]|jgi:hypothetical protein|nr:hypothetical protein [Candidatus Angelobacter sp.]
MIRPSRPHLRRLLPLGRALRVFVVVLVLGSLGGAVNAAHPFSGTLAGSPAEERLAAYDATPNIGASPLHIVEPGYAVWAEPHSAVVTLATPEGRVYTSMPLAALAGRTQLPAAATPQTTLHGGVLTTRMLDASGNVLCQADLTPGPTSFTVAFSAPIGPTPAVETAFFGDGHRGLGMTTVEDGYTPDPRGPASSLAPQVSTVSRTPFAPPPFQIQLRATPGWFGIGLVQVPSANSMRLGRDGAISIDYPLTQAGSQADLGAGPAQDGLVRFPQFVVTFAADPQSGLRAYHDALVSLRAMTVASPPGSRPAWWSEPLVDTWGEQVALKAHRGSPLFTADWVRAFVADWRARYHVDHFTLIIDSRWQERIGDPMPDPIRFGGVAGMRKLVDDLHTQGCHVLLWWPMWAHGVTTIPMSAKQARLATADRLIDPTAAEFASQMTNTVTSLLGSGPDQLGADGLKLDWQYDIPATLANPGQAYGALALYRYMDAIHTAAHAVRQDAMVDASAAAPQFAAVADTVRLYDAWNAAEWDRRAAIVAAVNPDVLIDGDGWQADVVSIVPHTVASTVYGTPSIYFSKTMMGGIPVAPSLSDQLGAVLALSGTKGQGRAVALADGEWQYEVGTVVTARTFAHDHALVVRTPGCSSATWKSTVASAVAGRLLVPMTGKHLVGAVDSAGHHAVATAVAHGVMLTMRAGGVYQLTFSGGC